MKNLWPSIAAFAIWFYHLILRYSCYMLSVDTEIPLSCLLGVYILFASLSWSNIVSLIALKSIGCYVQILSLVPELVNLFAQVAASPVETPEVKVHIGRAFSHLISLYGHQIQPLLANLSPAHANALAATASKSWHRERQMLNFSSLFFLTLASNFSRRFVVQSIGSWDDLPERRLWFDPGMLLISREWGIRYALGSCCID